MKNKVIGLLVLVTLTIFTIGGFVVIGKKPTTTVSTASTLGEQSTTSNTATSAESSSSFSLADVAKHTSKTDCWTVVNGNVYNITSYVPVHPGGVAEIVRACGVDSTDLFNSIMQHGRSADNELASLKIGTLK